MVFKEKIKSIAAVLILAILLGFYFYKAASLKETFITGDLTGSDIINFNYPLKAYIAHSLLRGELPLWLPHIYCGFPLLAEAQGAIFYPFQIILYLLLPGFAAYNYLTILSYFMAGWFMYVFVRALKTGRLPALAAAIIYTYCGFMVVHLKHLNMITVCAWFPLELFLIEKLFQEKKAVYALLLSAVIALQVLAGHPQFVLITLLGATLYFLFKLITSAEKNPVFFGGLFFSAVIIGLGLTLFQILPSMEFTALSERSGDSAWAAQEAYKPGDFTALVWPYYQGDPAKGTYNYEVNKTFWEKCAYAGILPLFIFLFALVKMRRNKIFLFFTGFLILGMVLSLGNAGLLFPLLLKLPGFSYFRFPGRFMFFFDFSIAVLCALSLENLRRLKIVQIAVMLILIYDLFSFGINHNATFPVKEWLKKPETVKYLENDQSEYRIFSYKSYLAWSMLNRDLARGWSGDLSPYNNYRAVLQQNSNLLYGLEDAWGYSALWTRRMKILFWGFYGKAEWDWVKLMQMLNVKYVVSLFPLAEKDLELKMQTGIAWRFPQVKIYEVKKTLPRAFAVPKASYADSSREVLQRLFSKNFDPRREVVLEKKNDWGTNALFQSRVKTIKAEPMEKIVFADLNNPGFLVVSDTYYPGWEVYVDGKKGEILQANFVMRAVELASGAHTVRFAYRPRSYETGKNISIGFAVLFCLSLGYLQWKKLKN